VAAARLPADPGAFVAATEQALNHRDMQATVAVYSPDAVMESEQDDLHDRFVGAEAIRAAWQRLFEEMTASGMEVSKTLESAQGATVLARYEARLADGRSGGGIETWRFDEAGLVVEHHLYGFVQARPPGGLRARLRLLMSFPRVGLALLRDRRR
jgi:ketosteroid isomerase-like protein